MTSALYCAEKRSVYICSYIVKYKIHLTSIFKVSLCFLDNCTVITLEDLQHGCSAVKPHVIERSNFLSDLRSCYFPPIYLELKQNLFPDVLD